MKVTYSSLHELINYSFMALFVSTCESTSQGRRLDCSRFEGGEAEVQRLEIHCQGHNSQRQKGRNKFRSSEFQL